MLEKTIMQLISEPIYEGLGYRIDGNAIIRRTENGDEMMVVNHIDGAQTLHAESFQDFETGELEITFSLEIDDDVVHFNGKAGHVIMPRAETSYAERSPRICLICGADVDAQRYTPFVEYDFCYNCTKDKLLNWINNTLPSKREAIWFSSFCLDCIYDFTSVENTIKTKDTVRMAVSKYVRHMQLKQWKNKVFADDTYQWEELLPHLSSGAVKNRVLTAGQTGDVPDERFHGTFNKLCKDFEKYLLKFTKK